MLLVYLYVLLYIQDVMNFDTHKKSKNPQLTHLSEAKEGIVFYIAFNSY